MTDEAQDRPAPIRVALSNDYEIALLGLAQMLARHPDQVQVVDLTTLTTMPREADVILFDTFGRLPDGDQKLRKVVAENTGKVVVYSWEEYPEEAALQHGAVGYLHKGLNAAQLVAAIVALHDGNPPRDADGDDDPVLTWPGQALGLSQRESEMLSFITRGLTNEEIARRSYLSINTVKTYIRTAYRKIHVSSRSQAVAWGYRNGFDSTDDTGV
ncbi:response regulator transcription factor [Nocardioides endophyticus]|uniref:Response regulator transcription factor n=1 Tax=Nocardioides endophyticus TaxID=1353775 RepID=A0ABP8YN90_9ACTN